MAGDDEGGEEMARLQWWPGNCGGGGATLGFHGRGRTLGFAQIGSRERLSYKEAEELESARQQQEGNCVDHGGRLARWVSRQHGEAEKPTTNQPPCVNQGRMLWGLAALRA